MIIDFLEKELNLKEAKEAIEKENGKVDDSQIGIAVTPHVLHMLIRNCMDTIQEQLEEGVMAADMELDEQEELSAELDEVAQQKYLH